MKNYCTNNENTLFELLNIAQKGALQKIKMSIFYLSINQNKQSTDNTYYPKFIIAKFLYKHQKSKSKQPQPPFPGGNNKN